MADCGFFRQVCCKERIVNYESLFAGAYNKLPGPKFTAFTEM